MFCPYISLNINEIFCTFEQKIIDFICSSSAHKMQHQLANWEGIPKKKRVEDGKNFGMRLSVRERGFFYVELEIMHRQLDERQREAQKEKIK